MRNGDGLPEGWVSASLGEVCEVVTGGTPPRKIIRYYGGTVPWVKPDDLDRTTYVDSSAEYLSDEGAAVARLLPAGAVLVSCIGKLGKSAIAQRQLATNQQINSLVPYGDLNSVYVYYACKWIKPALEAMVSGTVVPIVNKAAFSTLEIRISPVPEQRRIVEAIEQQFTRLDAGVTALKRARVALKRYRAAVLKAAVEGKLTAAWRAEHPNVEPASDLLQRILAERRARWEADVRAKGKDPANIRYDAPEAPATANLLELPEGWCWASLGQIATFQNGRPFPSKEYASTGIRLLRPGNLFADGSVRWTESNTRYMPIAWAETNPDLLISGGELVMNLTAQSLKDEFLGRVCLTSSDEHCLLNQRLARITPIAGLDSRYALYLLKSSLFRRFVDGLNTGSLIQHMFTSQLNDFVCPLPPMKEQEQIVAEVEQRLSIVSELEATVEANLKRAERLRQSILERAFTGKLVPQYPDDEPASVLLERIQEQRALPKSNGQTGHRVMPVTTQAALWDKE